MFIKNNLLPPAIIVKKKLTLIGVVDLAVLRDVYQLNREASTDVIGNLSFFKPTITKRKVQTAKRKATTKSFKFCASTLRFAL
jgi:hypothetical protein